jgi:hypothetical protein
MSVCLDVSLGVVVMVGNGVAVIVEDGFGLQE